MNDSALRSGGRIGDMPALLRLCIEERIVDVETAERIEECRRTCGIGLVRASSEFGVPLDFQFDTEIPPDTFVPLLLSAAPDPSKRFESFVPSEQNRRIVQIAAEMAEGSARPPFLYLFGPLGLGKTHLLSAMANARDPERTALAHAVDFTFEYERAFRQWRRAEFLRWLDRVDMLMIDDVHFLREESAAQHVLYALINRFQETGKSVVVSADVSPRGLRCIDPRLVSRFNTGVVINLTMPSAETRKEIIKRMGGAERLTEEVVSYLAMNVKDNIRHLKAAVTQILALSAREEIDVGVDLARAIVPLPEDLEFPSRPSRSPMDDERPLEDLRAREFKSMLESANTEDEQVLALQIIIGTKLRELRETGGAPAEQAKLESALKYLREGKRKEAIACIG